MSLKGGLQLRAIDYSHYKTQNNKVLARFSRRARSFAILFLGQRVASWSVRDGRARLTYRLCCRLGARKGGNGTNCDVGREIRLRPITAADL